ncbi:hypothetical protein EDB19DRAFT_1918468 [Suillus lakei]|nr:hypothetical protein EDB19DRAFT_1918468 [Suillus lakei]
MAWLFELAGGALCDFEDNCTPKAQRQASFNVAALHRWDIDFQDLRCVHSTEEWIAETTEAVFGAAKAVDLIPDGGSNVPVTRENRLQYIYYFSLQAEQADQAPERGIL